MDCKNKKYKPKKPPSSTDIGELLRRLQYQLRPVMASLGDLGTICIQVVKEPAPSTPTIVTGMLVTEGMLRGLLDELRRYIAADIGQFREDIGGMSARTTLE
ncbi:Hypothetical predicted protein [Pelobates cultripes]|uniref:Uncharacterized protein n=1 Tax=Pelobates cultripes TaxID=61616 RepID=A0AAD1THC9_PELCU|nr:Hypothetical predicted protein [Pelobates cultripes]